LLDFEEIVPARKPHSFRLAAETVFEIANAPKHLGLLIPIVREREDHVVLILGEGRAVAGESFLALPIRLVDGVMHPRHFLLHPGEKGGAEIETDA
jgi:hypothetical protein